MYILLGAITLIFIFMEMKVWFHSNQAVTVIETNTTLPVKFNEPAPVYESIVIDQESSPIYAESTLDVEGIAFLNELLQGKESFIDVAEEVLPMSENVGQ